MTGEAIGRPERAQELVDETEKLIADSAAEHPDFKGRSAAIITDYEGKAVARRAPQKVGAD